MNESPITAEKQLSALTSRLRIGVGIMMGMVFLLAFATIRRLIQVDALVLLMGVGIILYAFYRYTIFPYIYELHSQMLTDRKVGEESMRAAHMLIRRDLELTRANDRLRELDQAKSNFISIVAHQLRTPLSGVKWTLNMVITESLGKITTEQKSFLMKCYESNERMILLINDMLGADRIDSDKARYRFVPTQITDLMDNALFDLTSQINNKKLKVTFQKADRNLPQVMIDTEKMRAVLQNLLENAIKYTSSGGHIEIGFEEKDGFVQVSIKDSGIGIPEADKKNIFHRFFRATNALKVETDGSGLGLFIARGIIEKHGGKIWFESAAGEGTTFFFNIPIKH